MNKILIVLKSEFTRRVKTKTFVLMTLLGPVFMIAVILLPSLVGIFTAKSQKHEIAVVDETQVLLPMLEERSGEQLTLVAAEGSEEDLRTAVREKEYDGYLTIPADVLQGQGELAYYSTEGGGLSLPDDLERMVERAVRDYRLNENGVADEVRAILNTDLSMRRVKLTETGEEVDSSAASSIIGLIMGFFIYMSMFIYGAYVLQGVMEEKQTRVVETVVSSVRPFQLLMGKVLGIGAMGLLQMGAWVIFLILITVFSGSVIASFLNPADFNLPAGVSQQELLAAADFSIPHIPISVLAWFLLFFLGGYLIYASLYAAVGSAVEQQQDAQGLMMPIIMLIILPMLFISVLLQAPNSTLAVVLSVIPFFAPILMVVRMMVTQVPFWQIALSYLLVIGGFVTTIWVSSRIYRVGILMYGKKPKLKDLVRWIRYA